MSKRRDDIVLEDTINAAQLVSAFVEGFEKDAFMDDWKTRSAVLYPLTVIGEAVKRLSAVPPHTCTGSLGADGRNPRPPDPCL